MTAENQELMTTEEREYYMPFVTETIEKGMFPEYDYWYNKGLEIAREKNIHTLIYSEFCSEFARGMAEGALTARIELLRELINSGHTIEEIEEQFGQDEAKLARAIKDSYLIPGKVPVKCSLLITEEGNRITIKDVTTGISAQAENITEATENLHKLLKEHYESVSNDQKKSCTCKLKEQTWML